MQDLTYASASQRRLLASTLPSSATRQQVANAAYHMRNFGMSVSQLRRCRVEELCSLLETLPHNFADLQPDEQEAVVMGLYGMEVVPVVLEVVRRFYASEEDASSSESDTDSETEALGRGLHKNPPARQQQQQQQQQLPPNVLTLMEGGADSRSLRSGAATSDRHALGSAAASAYEGTEGDTLTHSSMSAAGLATLSAHLPVLEDGSAASLRSRRTVRYADEVDGDYNYTGGMATGLEGATTGDDPMAVAAFVERLGHVSTDARAYRARQRAAESAHSRAQAAHDRRVVEGVSHSMAGAQQPQRTTVEGTHAGV